MGKRRQHSCQKVKATQILFAIVLFHVAPFSNCGCNLPPTGGGVTSGFSTVDLLRKRLHEKIEESKGQVWSAQVGLFDGILLLITPVSQRNID